MTTLYFIEHTSVFPILFNHFHPLNLFSCSLIVEHEVYVLFLGLDPACLSLPQTVLPFQGFLCLLVKGL